MHEPNIGPSAASNWQPAAHTQSTL